MVFYLITVDYDMLFSIYYYLIISSDILKVNFKNLGRILIMLICLSLALSRKTRILTPLSFYAFLTMVFR